MQQIKVGGLCRLRQENGKTMFFFINLTEMTLFATANANLPLLFLAASSGPYVIKGLSSVLSEFFFRSSQFARKHMN